MAHFILDFFYLLIKWQEMVLEQGHDKSMTYLSKEDP